MLYKPTTTIKPGILFELKIKEPVDSPPVQIMVGVKALFWEYSIETIIAIVVYNGYYTQQ